MLFGNTKIVIYLSLTKVIVGDCRHTKPIYFEINYDKNLVAVFDKIIKQLPSSSYKIILGQDVSYTVKWDKIGENQDRLEVRDELVKHIPENFADAQFDWKIDKEQKIEAIVIVKNTYDSLQQIRAKYPSMRLETQSATSLLWETGKSEQESEVSAELFDFAAQKGRERGKDEMVLNIEIEPTKSIDPTKPDKTMNKSTIYVVMILVVILSMFGAWWILSLNQSSSPIITPISSAEPISTFTSSPQKKASDYKILIQNGTNIAGYAGEIKTKLEALGFTQVETGNSKNDSLDTTINIAEALPDAIQKMLLESLKPLEPSITVEGNDTTLNINDIVIILGTK